MDPDLLNQRLEIYKEHITRHPAQFEREASERARRCAYYQGWTRDRLLGISEADLFDYISGLWATLGWGNKRYMVDKLVRDNGFDPLRSALADLTWGGDPLVSRWDQFKAGIRGCGPAIMSELLCYHYPSDCMVWNRRAYAGLSQLGMRQLPLHNYQLTGRKYAELSLEAKKISERLKGIGLPDATLLTVDTMILFHPKASWVSKWGNSWFKDI